MSVDLTKIVPRFLVVKDQSGDNSHFQVFRAECNYYYRLDQSEVVRLQATEAQLEYFTRHALCFSNDDAFFVYLEPTGIASLFRSKNHSFRAACMSNGDEVTTFDSNGQHVDTVLAGEIQSMEFRVIDSGRRIVCVAHTDASCETILLQTGLYRWYDYWDPTIPDGVEVDLAVLSIQSLMHRLVAPHRIETTITYHLSAVDGLA